MQIVAWHRLISVDGSTFNISIRLIYVKLVNQKAKAPCDAFNTAIEYAVAHRFLDFMLSRNAYKKG